MAPQQKGIWPSPTVPHMANLGRRWARSGVVFGAAGFLAVTFFCDWKDVLIRVPFFNKPFKQE
ncbi:Ubiquinol-cytochrome C reductase complex, 6.4kD protein [Blomia tropicalis]|nr:Ubiquinol-cytochrome C reductase complex, 6.4kD protein [Blomia tropicalis]